MSQIRRPGQPNSPVERTGTLIETDEEVRQAVLSGLRGQQQPAPVDRAPAAPPPSPPSQAQPAPAPPLAVSPFRPTSRPPLAILTVFDDGKAEGEVIRIRDSRFIIGRTEGDLRIPIDGRMSSRHVEITLQTIGGIHRWVVTDLQSTHGMFVRVTRTVLNDRSEIPGRQRPLPVRIPAGAGRGDPRSASPGRAGGVRADPRLGRRPQPLPRTGGDRAHGRRDRQPHAPDQAGVLDRLPTRPAPSAARDDPFCEPRHVRLSRDSKGGWHAEHNKTLNGLWVRMAQIVVDSVVRFQIGEQRFQIKV